MKLSLKAIGASAIVVAGLLYLGFGTLSPCGILRETVRQQDKLAAVLPDSVVDVALAAKYGALSPGRCVGVLLNEPLAQPQATSSAHQLPVQQQAVPPIAPAPQASTAPTTSDQALTAAFKQAETAMNECKAKRIGGELKTHVASVNCSNPRLMQAYSAAHYKYMDLINLLAAKRLELAGKLDRNELSEDQAQREITKLFALLSDTARRRDSETTDANAVYGHCLVVTKGDTAECDDQMRKLRKEQYGGAP